MATIIDSLMVTLGLDAAKFDNERKKVDEGLEKTRTKAKASAKDTEDGAKQMALMFSKLRGEVVGLFLAFNGAKAIVGIFKDTVNTAAAVGRASSVFGMSTNVVNAWGDALKGAGGSAQEAIGVFGKIKDIQADFVRHPERLNAPLMGQLGFKGRKDFNDGPGVMLHLADQFQAEMAKAKTNDDKDLVKATFRQRVKEFLGLSDEYINLIEKGRPALEAQIREYEIRDRLTEKDAQQAQEFNNALTHLEKSFMGLARTPLVAVAEELAGIMDVLSGNADKSNHTVRNLALGFYALLHPVDTLVHILANKGYLPQWMDTMGRDPIVQALAGGGGSGGGGGGGAASPGQRAALAGNGGAGASYGRGINDGHKQRFAQAVGWFTSSAGGGFTEDQARGMAAGLFSESSLNPQSHNSIGMQGIGQWDGKRRAAFRAKFGHDPVQGTLAEQLQFVSHELATTERGSAGAIHGAKSSTAAAHALIAGYERPQGKFLPTLGRFEHQKDLQGDYDRSAAMLAATAGRRGGGGGGAPQVNVTVHAPGHPAPHKVAQATGRAVKGALAGRHHVANANRGLQ